MSKEIAKTILEQLGGNKFIVMTGAKNLMHDENGLIFKIGRNKSKANYVKIELNEKDLYNVTFGKIAQYDYKILKEYKDVYAESLKDIFTEYTGLDTSLANPKKKIKIVPFPVAGKGTDTIFKFPNGKYYYFDYYAKSQAENLEDYAKKYNFIAYDTYEDAIKLFVTDKKNPKLNTVKHYETLAKTLKMLIKEADMPSAKQNFESQLEYVNDQLDKAKKVSKKNPLGYHDVSLKYKLEGIPFKQTFINIKSQTMDIAKQKAIIALDIISGDKVKLEGTSTRKNPKKEWFKGEIRKIYPSPQYRKNAKTFFVKTDAIGENESIIFPEKYDKGLKEGMKIRFTKYMKADGDFLIDEIRKIKK